MRNKYYWLLQTGFSENPTLTAFYARASVAGIQNDNGGGPYTYLDENHGISSAKHYAAYGNALGVCVCVCVVFVSLTL